MKEFEAEKTLDGWKGMARVDASGSASLALRGLQAALVLMVVSMLIQATPLFLISAAMAGAAGVWMVVWPSRRVPWSVGPVRMSVGKREISLSPDTEFEVVSTLGTGLSHSSAPASTGGREGGVATLILNIRTGSTHTELLFDPQTHSEHAVKWLADVAREVQRPVGGEVPESLERLRRPEKVRT